MKYALCVGINDYPGTGSDLAGCVNDANDFANVFEDCGFQVTTLLDSQAIGDNIRAAITQHVARAESGDTAIVTYSGHGTWVSDRDGDEADERDEALCPHDIFTKGPIVDDELYSMFTARNWGARVVFISDSCHSGTVTRLAAPLSPEPNRQVRFLPPATFLPEDQVDAAARLARAPSRPMRSSALLMSGCADPEYSYDAWFDGRPNGAFTKAALIALRDGPVLYRDWHRRIRGLLPSSDYPQTPMLFGTWSQKRWPVLR